jgi:trans-aconitate methyltransferase
VTINKSALRELYEISDMEYLDRDSASPIYACQADLIKQQELVGIVDVGCRVGKINAYLSDYDYHYYGFDTSPEPISHAISSYPSKIFEVGSWHDPVLPHFNVDVILFSSVLIYAVDPITMFEQLCTFYQPTVAIIHEINNQNTADFNYIDLGYFADKYSCDRYEFDLDIPCGKRTILNVQYQ